MVQSDLSNEKSGSIKEFSLKKQAKTHEATKKKAKKMT
jgi:hypothetical protein